jgi:hypothetical protein
MPRGHRQADPDEHENDGNRSADGRRREGVAVADGHDRRDCPPQAVRERGDVPVRHAAFDFGNQHAGRDRHDHRDEQGVVQLVSRQHVAGSVEAPEEEGTDAGRTQEPEHARRPGDAERPEERHDDDDEVDDVRAHEPALGRREVQADAVRRRRCPR